MLSNFFNGSQLLTYIYLNMVVYSIPLVLFYLYLDDRDIPLFLFSKNNSKLFFTKITLLLFIVNLAGLPPLPGFFIKLNLFLILSNYTNLIVSILFVVFNFIIFFFYIRVYKRITYLKNKINKINNLFTNKLIISMFIYIVIFPLMYPHLMVWAYTIFI